MLAGPSCEDAHARASPILGRVTDVNESGTTRFARLGGREALARLVDAFYSRIERDPELRPIFPEDLAPGREKQKRFLEQWLGGEPRYAQRYGEPALRRRHLPFPITAPARRALASSLRRRSRGVRSRDGAGSRDPRGAAPDRPAHGEHDGRRAAASGAGVTQPAALALSRAAGYGDPTN